MQTQSERVKEPRVLRVKSSLQWTLCDIWLSCAFACVYVGVMEMSGKYQLYKIVRVILIYKEKIYKEKWSLNLQKIKREWFQSFGATRADYDINERTGGPAGEN